MSSPVRAVRRPGKVYGFRVLHPVTGVVDDAGYVGQTRQAGRGRELQHRDDKPWADTIVGDPYIIAEGMWTDGQLDRAESDAITRLSPLYNIDQNRDNPRRIPPWDAVRQRAERDRANARPAWTPTVTATVDRQFRPLRGWHVALTAWALLAPVTCHVAASGGIGSVRALIVGAVSAALVVAWGVWRGDRVWRQATGRRRQTTQRRRRRPSPARR